VWHPSEISDGLLAHVQSPCKVGSSVPKRIHNTGCNITFLAQRKPIFEAELSAFLGACLLFEVLKNRQQLVLANQELIDLQTEIGLPDVLYQCGVSVTRLSLRSDSRRLGCGAVGSA
jgi:hypothetical protein